MSNTNYYIKQAVADLNQAESSLSIEITRLEAEKEGYLNTAKDQSVRILELERDLSNKRDEAEAVKLDLVAANRNNEHIGIERELILSCMHKAIYEKSVLEDKLKEVEHIETEYEGMKHNLGMTHYENVQLRARITVAENIFHRLVAAERVTGYLQNCYVTHDQPDPLVLDRLVADWIKIS